MKIMFNYQNDFFKPVLGYSILAHAILFGVGMMSYGSPHFAVTQGTNAIDVVILEEKKETAKPKEEMLENPESVISESVQKIEEKKLENIEQPITSLSEDKAISEDDPIYLRNPAPSYPRYARERGWEGVVILRVLVNREGHAQEVTVEKSSGYQILDQSALKTIRKWQFDPVRIGNLRFESWVKIPIRFVIVEELKK